MYIHNPEKEERDVRNKRGNRLKLMTIVLQQWSTFYRNSQFHFCVDQI